MRSSSDATSFSFAGLPKDYAYHKIDSEIALLQERLSTLQTLRNSLAPISQIPTELLSKIFFHTQDRISAPLHYRFDLKTRFFVSWVCRHWRRTALATPALWTIVTEQKKDAPIQIDLVEELLARSCHRDLAIDLSKPTTEVLTACLTHMARIAHLRLLSADRDEEIDPLSSQPSPALISLDLKGLRHLPPFSGVHPRLCHLTISNSDIISLTPLIAPTLTRLHLLNNSFISFETLFEALTTLANLAELSLLNALQHVEENPVHRLALPNLQVLSMSQRRSITMFRFLSHLSIPQASISLIWKDIDPSYSTIAVSSQFETYRDQIQFQIHHFEIKNAPFEVSLHLSDTALRHRYTFQFPKRVRKYIDSFCTAVSLEELTSLSTNEFSLPVLVGFKKLHNLRTITLNGKEALRDCVSHIRVDIEGKEDIPFAAMKELVIRKVDGKEATSGLDQLHQVLVARREAGMGLTKLVFEKCDADVGRFEGLADVLSDS